MFVDFNFCVRLCAGLCVVCGMINYRKRRGKNRLM